MERLAQLFRFQPHPLPLYCAFAGLRSAEVKSLSWQQIDLKRNLITVPEQISRTGEERKIPIQPNLAAWLAPQAQATGFILSREHCHGADYRLKAAKGAAGLWPWSPRFQNALRKSFCSYHYEMFGSATRTASLPESRNSEPASNSMARSVANRRQTGITGRFSLSPAYGHDLSPFGASFSLPTPPRRSPALPPNPRRPNYLPSP